MLYLQQSLKHLSQLDPSFSIEDYQNTLSLELKEWNHVSCFFQYYSKMEERYTEAQMQLNDIWLKYRAMSIHDSDLHEYALARMDLRSAMNISEFYLRTLRELAMVFAVHHYLKVEGYELDPAVYEYTVDSQNVSVE